MASLQIGTLIDRFTVGKKRGKDVNNIGILILGSANLIDAILDGYIEWTVVEAIIASTEETSSNVLRKIEFLRKMEVILAGYTCLKGDIGASADTKGRNDFKDLSQEYEEFIDIDMLNKLGSIIPEDTLLFDYIEKLKEMLLASMCNDDCGPHVSGLEIGDTVVRHFQGMEVLCRVIAFNGSRVVVQYDIGNHSSQTEFHGKSGRSVHPRMGYINIPPREAA